MNKKTIGIVSSGTIVAITIVLLFVTNSGVTEQNQQNVSGGFPPSPPILELVNNPVASEQLAATKVGYSVKSPTYLPTGYTVQVISTNDQIKATTILASPQPVTQQTTLNEFLMGQKGIFLYMEQKSPAFNQSEWMQAWTAQESGRTVTVNGFNGVVHDIQVRKGIGGEDIQLPAELVFFKNNLEIEIRGMLPTNELIKIAETL